MQKGINCEIDILNLKRESKKLSDIFWIGFEMLCQGVYKWLSNPKRLKEAGMTEKGPGV